MKNGGLLSQDQESGTVFLAYELSYTDPDPSQQWTLDYNGEMRLHLSDASLQISLYFSGGCAADRGGLLPEPGGGPGL